MFDDARIRILWRSKLHMGIMCISLMDDSAVRNNDHSLVFAFHITFYKDDVYGPISSFICGTEFRTYVHTSAH